MLLLIGIPLYFLEMLIGQYAGLSATKVYRHMTPGVRGMGYGMVTIPVIMNFQYVVIMAYAMFFLFAGFQSTVPWSTCDDDYNSPHCYSLTAAEKCASDEAYYNNRCMPGQEFCALYNYSYDPSNPEYCFSSRYILNASGPIPFQDVTYRVSSSEDYWYHFVLHLDYENGELNKENTWWNHWGKPRWPIIACLLLSWALICLSLIQGVQSYGKVVYFTTLFPYVVLTISHGYVATLPGFKKGIEFYIIPQDWSKMLDVNVWNDAASQIFYSLGVAVGSQMLLSSYNVFRNNCHRDALLIGFCNSLTSLYAGFTVFGVIGFLAEIKEQDIDEVVTEGPGLAFIVYPEAVSNMVAAPFFSFLFFFMLNLLAMSSVCAQWEALIAAIIDEFPQLKAKRVILLISTCFGAFLCGVPMCFESGFLLFTLMDRRVGNSILPMGFLEIVCISYFYGIPKVLLHLKEMEVSLPSAMKWYWRVCWMLFAPLIIGLVTVLAWVNFTPDNFEGIVFPAGVQALGWFIELTPLAIVILVTLVVIVRRVRAGKSVAFLQVGPMMRPTPHWGPRPDTGKPKEDDISSFTTRTSF